MSVESEIKQLRTDLDMLARDFHTYREQEMQARSDQLDKLSQLVRVQTELAHDTRDVVEIYKDLRGAIRVGVSLQNAAVWVLKWGAVGAATALAIKKFLLT